MRSRIWLIVVASVTTTATAFSAIINVPGDYPTIQAGIDAAVEGDEIVVGSGVYVENLSISKQITLRAANEADVTVDGAGVERCLLIANVDSGPVVVNGITFTGGSRNDWGSGVFVDNARASFSDCRIWNNFTTESFGCAWCTGRLVRGGGMSVANGALVTLAECEFVGNKVQIQFSAWGANGQARGGGLYVENATVDLLDCVFDGNTAAANDYPPNCSNCNHPTTGAGGAICVAEGAVVTATNVTVSGNEIDGENTSYGLGAGIACLGGDVTLINALLTDNRSEIPDNCYCGGERNYGGALYAEGGSVEIIDSMIESNTAAGSSDDQGGAVFVTKGVVSISGTNICGNSEPAITGPWNDAGGNSILTECDPPFLLDVSATCPGGGLITISWSGATPNARAALIFSLETGNLIVPPGFPCQGTQLGLGFEQTQVAFLGPSDANGERFLEAFAGDGACGGLLQVLDLTTCEVSNVAVID